jgi:hypothetical protein
MANAHLARFHGPKPEFDMSKPSCLKKTMFCVCGFGAYSGNKLATHLALCGKKSAYPSRHRASLATVSAQSATFPELVTLDDDDEEDGEDAGGDYGNDSFGGEDYGAMDDDDVGGGGSRSADVGGMAVGPDGKKKKRE